MIYWPMQGFLPSPELFLDWFEAKIFVYSKYWIEQTMNNTKIKQKWTRKQVPAKIWSQQQLAPIFPRVS